MKLASGKRVAKTGSSLDSSAREGSATSTSKDVSRRARARCKRAAWHDAAGAAVGRAAAAAATGEGGARRRQRRG
eukprot:scaffold88575_cov69-Phaeocystis_antarctica.AAC.8